MWGGLPVDQTGKPLARKSRRGELESQLAATILFNLMWMVPARLRVAADAV